MANTPEWTVLEKLLLAQAVYKFGEDSWVQIARNLRQHNMLHRKPEFFNQKNCSLQYYLMIEQLESEMRRQTKSVVAAQDMPPVVKLARQLYMQRIDELKEEIKNDEDRFLSLISDIDALRSGHQDAILAAELEKRKDAQNPVSALKEDQPDQRNMLQVGDSAIVTPVQDSLGDKTPKSRDGKVHIPIAKDGREQPAEFSPPASPKDSPPAMSDTGERQMPSTQMDDVSTLGKEDRKRDNIPCSEKADFISSSLPSTTTPNRIALTQHFDETDQKRRASSPKDENVKRRRIKEAEDKGKHDLVNGDSISS